MQSIELPEKTDDFSDIPDWFTERFVLTSDGFREQIVWGSFPDVMFTDED